MDAKNKTLDRILEALSPALATELDRVAQETKDSLEQELQDRVQSTAQQAQAERERAVEAAKEETRRQVTSELEQQFNAKLEATTTQLKNEAAEERTKSEASMTEAKNTWAAERAKLDEELEKWRALANSPRELGDASSQPEILLRFLRITQPFAEGLAVYVSKADGLALWKSRGKGAFPEIVSQQTTDPDSYFRTIVIRGKTLGAISAVPPFKADSLDFLVGSLERAIELFGVRLKTPASKTVSEPA